MELTPEDRKRIYEEEKARMEAVGLPKPEVPSNFGWSPQKLSPEYRANLDPLPQASTPYVGWDASKAKTTHHYFLIAAAVAIGLLVVGGYWYYQAVYMSLDSQLARNNVELQAARSNVYALGMDPEFSLEKFGSIRNGMSYGEVVAVIGFEGAESARNNIAGHETVAYVWHGQHTNANMNAMFQDGKLVSKAQAGMRRTKF
jgi:hypothetical protein